MSNVIPFGTYDPDEAMRNRVEPPKEAPTPEQTPVHDFEPADGAPQYCAVCGWHETDSVQHG